MLNLTWPDAVTICVGFVCMMIILVAVFGKAGK